MLAMNTTKNARNATQAIGTWKYDARGVALDAVGLRDEEHAVCGHREEQEAAQAEDAGQHKATKSIAHVGAREGIGTLTLAWPRSPRSPWCRADLVTWRMRSTRSCWSARPRTRSASANRSES